MNVREYRHTKDPTCPIVVTLLASTKLEVPRGYFKGRPDQAQGTDAEVVTEAAGRVCYDSWGKGRSSAEYHEHIRESGHKSVTFHASLTVLIEHISHGCSAQLNRHKVGCAVSQRSQRYVDESDTPWVWHPAIRRLAEDNEDVRNALGEHEANARMLYGILVDELSASSTLAPLDARKEARGAARGVLGMAVETEEVFTFSVEALREFLRQRDNPHADEEIRQLADILRAVGHAVFGSYVEVSHE